MSYEGARARFEANEGRRVFAVSKVRLGASGEVTDVLWGEINAKSNLDVGASFVVPVADVIDALHDGAQVSAVFPGSLGAMPDHAFEVVEHPSGIETIALIAQAEGSSHHRAGLTDLARLDG
jgi:hypothetical protein